MAKRKLPYMKLWVGDWLSSQRVVELTPMEEYCYFRLIMWAWQANASGLLNTDASLAQMCRVDMDTWLQVESNVRALFYEVEGRLFHEKVDEQILQQQEISEKRSAAGRLGGKAKGESNSLANASPLLKQTPKQTPYGYGSSSDSSSSSSSLKKESKFSKLDVRQKSKVIRDHYLKEVSPRDQTRTQALSMIDMYIQDEEIFSVEEMLLAIDRYAMEMKVSGSDRPISCRKFFSQEHFREFLRDDWEEPPIAPESEPTAAPVSFKQAQDEADEAEYQRLMDKRASEGG